MNTRTIKDTSLGAWDDIYCDGTLGDMMEKAYNLITNNPDRTVRELLQIGVEAGIYPREDRNLIAPRITGLCRDIWVYSTSKRNCTITGKWVSIFRVVPEEMSEQRKRLYQVSNGKVAKHRLEIDGKTDPSITHTVIWWYDETITCTCNTEYHRPSNYRCHHVKGLYEAITGRKYPTGFNKDLEDETENINKMR